MRHGFNKLMHYVIGVLAAFAATVCAAAVPASSTSADQQLTALVGGVLIDGHGGKPVEESVILISGERIVAVGTRHTIEIPAHAHVIRTDGMSVLPGLWDMHVHMMLAGHADYAHWDATYIEHFETVMMPAAAQQLLLAGVTSARDLGAPLEPILRVRDAIRDGRIPGPTLYVSGPFLQHAPYPGEEAYRWGIKNAADARAKVRQLAAAGVDTIKLVDQDRMEFSVVEAVVDEAHRHGLPVVAHAHRPEEVRRGLKAGIDCFEHTGFATAPEYPPDIITMLRERTADSSAGPLFWTPTVQGIINYARKRDNGDWLDDPSWHRGLPPAVVEDIRMSLRHRDRLAYSVMVPYRRPTVPRKFAQLRESGVMLLVGTDSGIPMSFHSQATWRELQAWVDVFGVDPMEAIRAATFWPAVLMKVSKDVGTVAKGKYADIIAVRGNVLEDISLLAQPALVIKRGTRYR